MAKAQATPANLGGLAAGFPRQVTAYRLWMTMAVSLGRSPTTDELLATLDNGSRTEQATEHLRDGWLAISYERLGQMIVEAWQRGRVGGTAAGRAPR